MAKTWAAYVDEDGNLSVIERTKFLANLQRFRGQPVELTVDKKHPLRSPDQLAYWFSVPVKILAEELGYTESQMHYALLGECFGFRPGLRGGPPIPNVSSSAELNTKRFKELIDWVLIWAPSELQIDIPPPDPNWRVNRR